MEIVNLASINLNMQGNNNEYTGILIIVSLHIHFNKLLMPFLLVAALSIRCKVYDCSCVISKRKLKDLNSQNKIQKI